MRRSEGEEGAREALARALDLARKAKRHWPKFEIASALAMLEPEARSAKIVLGLCHDIQPMASKLGEGGSEGRFVDALRGVARLMKAEEGASDALDQAVRALERADSHYHLAYVLNAAAEIDAAAGRTASARRRAEAALRSAMAVERRSETARAHLILAEGRGP